MSITWSKYFDRIYCLHFVEYTQRKEMLEVQLKRVGILDSGIFEYYYTYENIPNKKFETYIKNYTEESRRDFWLNVSISLGHYSIVREAYFKGYKNILIFEDDIRFLKKLNKIEQILEHRPEDADVILYDKFEFDFNKNANIKVNDYFSVFHKCASCGCYELNRRGMERVIQVCEKQLITADGFFYKPHIFLQGLNYYTNINNMAIQVQFSNNQHNTTWPDLENNERSYKFQNINYDNYNMNVDGTPYYYGDEIKQKIDENNNIKISEKQFVDKTKQIKPTEMNICFSVTCNHLDKLLPIIYSIQKYSKSKLNFFIISDIGDFEKYSSQLNKLKDDRTTFKLIDGTFILKAVHPSFNHYKTMLSYAKMFIPTLLPELDRVLYLDYDTIIAKEGIEWLYNTDFEDNYLAVMPDIQNQDLSQLDINTRDWVEYDTFKHLTNYYFNSGVLLINNKKIIEDGLDKFIINLLADKAPDSDNNDQLKKIWNTMEEMKLKKQKMLFQFCDQSIFNYVFKNKTKHMSPIFDNLLFYVNLIIFKNYLKEKWDINSKKEFMDNSIVYHFIGLKPWGYWPENQYLFGKYKTQAVKYYQTLKKEMQEKLKDDSVE